MKRYVAISANKKNKKKFHALYQVKLHTKDGQLT